MPFKGIAEAMINATIKKENLTPHIYTTPIDDKHYSIDLIAAKVGLVNSSEPPDAVLFKARLDIINYDKVNDYYQFRLSLIPGIIILSHGDIGGPSINIDRAKIFFAENRRDSMIIEGKINREFGKGQDQFSRDNDSYPVIHESNPRPFEVSVSKSNSLILSPRHDIPVYIMAD